MTRKYLFNPDKLNHYQTYEVKYGGSRLDGILETSLVRFQKDPQVRAQYAYRKLLQEIKLVPGDAWNDVTATGYILTAPPEKLLLTNGRSRQLTVLDRIDREDYERLSAAAEKQNPTNDDVKALGELIDRILAESL